MLQKLSHHIAACLDRAADCRRRAEQTITPVMKADLLDRPAGPIWPGTMNSSKASSGSCSAPRNAKRGIRA